VLNLILLAIAAAAVWTLFVLASPVGRCRRCRGKRIIRTLWLHRIRKCHRCRGSGRAYRAGATAAHRLAWSIASEALTRRLRNRYQEGQR